MTETVSYDQHEEFLVQQILMATAELTGFSAARRWANPPNRYDSPQMQARYMRGFNDGQVKLMQENEHTRTENANHQGNEKKLALKCIWRRYLQLCAEGDELWGESIKLWAEGEKLWRESVMAAYGNVTMEWKSATHCIVDHTDEYQATAEGHTE